jgi:hypothetical protein
MRLLRHQLQWTAKLMQLSHVQMLHSLISPLFGQPHVPQLPTPCQWTTAAKVLMMAMGDCLLGCHQVVLAVELQYHEPCAPFSHKHTSCLSKLASEAVPFLRIACGPFASKALSVQTEILSLGTCYDMPHDHFHPPSQP